MFGRKLSVGNDLYEKLKQCSESAGYATAEEFALHTLEKEVDRILTGGESPGRADDESAEKIHEGPGYID